MRSVSRYRLCRNIFALAIAIVCGKIIVSLVLSPYTNNLRVISDRAPAKLAAVRHWPPSLSLSARMSALQQKNQLLCSHTVGERDFTADTTGNVCTHSGIGEDGCCTPDSVLNVTPCTEGCNTFWQCCRGHALCTSCCISTGDADFNECSNRCRTWSESIIAGNRYRSSMHNCYWKQPPSIQSSESNLILAATGQSCSEACRAIQRACSERHLALFNSCDALKENLSVSACDQSCVSSNKRHLPAIVGEGQCEINGKIHLLDCLEQHPTINRVCACVASPELDPNPMQ